MGKPRKAIVIDKKHGTTSVRSDRGSISVFSTERSNPPSYTQGSEPGSFVSSSRGGGPPSASHSSTFASGVSTGGARSYTSSSHGFVTLLKKKGAKCCLCATLHIVGTIEVKEPDFFWWNSKDDRKVHSRRNISFCEEHDSVVQEMIEAYRWGETIPILCTKVPGITFHLYRTSSASQPPSKSDQRPRPHSRPSGFTSQSPQSPQSSRQHTKHASTHPGEPSRSYRDLPEPSERSSSEGSASSDEEEDQLLWPADSTGYRPPGRRPGPEAVLSGAPDSCYQSESAEYPPDARSGASDRSGQTDFSHTAEGDAIQNLLSNIARAGCCICEYPAEGKGMRVTAPAFFTWSRGDTLWKDKSYEVTACSVHKAKVLDVMKEYRRLQNVQNDPELGAVKLKHHKYPQTCFHVFPSEDSKLLYIEYLKRRREQARR